MKVIRALACALACVFVATAKAEDGAFASRQQAMDYLAAELPRVTAQNPAYRTVSDGTVSKWLTDSVNFGADEGAVTVRMRENYTQSKDGKTIPGTHEASFSLADVEISQMTYPDDVTPDGAKGLGVLFTCRKPGCVAAVWGGQPSKADKTDISLQNDATRAKILAAFRYLQRAD